MHETDVVARGKAAAAAQAITLVEDGMVVGLGTGSTVNILIGLLVQARPDAVFVASSPRSAQLARDGGLRLAELSARGVDLTIDGADQVAPDGWLVKGGGGAHTREKILAAAAARFVVIVSADKLVERIEPPIPLELIAYGVEATMERLGTARLRDVDPSPDGGVIGDYLGSVADPRVLAQMLSTTPGVIEHGLFPPELVDRVIVG